MFDREINIEHKHIPKKKKKKNKMMRIIMAHNILKGFFSIWLC